MEVEMRIRGLMMDPVTNMPIVLLKESDSETVLPIWVGIRSEERRVGSDWSSDVCSSDLDGSRNENSRTNDGSRHQHAHRAPQGIGLGNRAAHLGRHQIGGAACRE